VNVAEKHPDSGLSLAFIVATREPVLVGSYLKWEESRHDDLLRLVRSFNSIRVVEKEKEEANNRIHRRKTLLDVASEEGRGDWIVNPGQLLLSSNYDFLRTLESDPVAAKKQAIEFILEHASEFREHDYEIVIEAIMTMLIPEIISEGEITCMPYSARTYALHVRNLYSFYIKWESRMPLIKFIITRNIAPYVKQFVDALRMKDSDGKDVIDKDELRRELGDLLDTTHPLLDLLLVSKKTRGSWDESLVKQAVSLSLSEKFQPLSITSTPKTSYPKMETNYFSAVAAGKKDALGHGSGRVKFNSIGKLS
jgi:hypothetical protein